MAGEVWTAEHLVSELPKFTKSMRAVTGLEGPKWAQYRLWDSVRRKYQIIENGMLDYESHFATDPLTWGKVKRILAKYTDTFRLTRFHQFVKEISSCENREEADEHTLYVLQLFLNDDLSFKQQIDQLKQRFGCSAASFGNELVVLIQEIMLNVDDEILAVLKTKTKIKEPLFGGDLPFVLNNIPSASDLIPEDKVFRLQDLDDLPDHVNNDTFRLGPMDEPERVEENEYGVHWLEDELKKFISEDDPTFSSPKDCAESVINKLMTEKSSEELQYDLCELLGFERVELIQNILTFRDEIISDFVLSTDNVRKASAGRSVVRVSFQSKKSQRSGDKKNSRNKTDCNHRKQALGTAEMIFKKEGRSRLVYRMRFGRCLGELPRQVVEGVSFADVPMAEFPPPTRNGLREKQCPRTSNGKARKTLSLFPSQLASQ